ncbi:hypothetical protein ACFFIS_04770 [Virgibacillus soli]|uniref:Uncharacterized protein n=1 Tax=Paracerasibacillus soli TaxID=480284 RepID=A0ABU5CVW9_9BACI|nr:hypothetical protein [Virgibacillus soli]MDY0409962.1 hypothetical protein [Virgibacillus soli]
MSDRTAELIEALRALAEVQRAGKTHVNSEIRTVLKELMQQLEL